MPRGCGQRSGVDSSNTFPPCLSGANTPLIAAITCELELDVCHSEDEQVLAQLELSDGVYMRLPRSAGVMSGKVVKLHRSRYGLKQASRQ